MHSLQGRISDERPKLRGTKIRRSHSHSWIRQSVGPMVGGRDKALEIFDSQQLRGYQVVQRGRLYVDSQ